MRIIYSMDFLVHDFNEKSHLMNDLTIKAIELAGIEIKSLSEAGFIRKKFFGLSLMEPKEKYFYFNCDLLSDSKQYLKLIIGNSIVWLFEAQPKTKKLLDELGITYINSWIHPFKLFDDILHSFETNDEKIWKRLKQYQVPIQEFKLYGAYWKTRIGFNPDFKKLKLEDNSLLIIGQTETDKSLERNGIMLSLNNYQNTINSLKKQFKKIYYKPHPNYYNSGSKRNKYYPNLVKFLKNNPEIEMVNHSTYFLLASDSIKKVIALSSSVLFEAKFFGKEIEYLYQPLFNFDNDNSADGISIFHSYFSPDFWAYLFDLDSAYNFQFNNPQNKIRNLIPDRGLFWGYSELDSEAILYSFKKRVEKKFRNIFTTIFKKF